MSMRSFVIMLALLAVCGATCAQTVMSSYLQTRATGGTYLAPGSTTSLFGTNWSGTTATPAAVTIPFSFNFLGTNYTTCYVNPNGYVTFGATSTGTNYTPLSVHDAGVNGIISALACNPLASANAVTYGITGTAPNRVFSIIWTAAKPGGLTGSTLNFQINLFETTNKAQVVYNSPSLGTTPSVTVTPQVGIGGSSNTDFLNWTDGASSTTTTAGGVTGNNWVLLKPGIVNTATCNMLRTNAAYFPASGLTLEWTPRLFLYSPSAINNTGFTMNWKPAAGATSYNVELSASSTFASYVSGYPSSVASSDTFKVATGLTTGTKYYYRVTPVYATTGFYSASTTYPITIPVAVPLSITPSSYNFDIIADGGNLPVGSTSFIGSTNNFITYNGLDHANWDLAAADFYNIAATNGLPIGGSLPETANNGIVYQLAPYSVNNVLWFATGSTSGTGTLTLTTPVALTTLYVAGLSGAGANTMSYTVNFTDGSNQSFTGQTLNDWCSGTAAVAARITRANTAENVENCPYVYKNTLALSSTNYTKLVSSVTVQCTGGTGTYPAIIGIAGQKTGVLTPSTSSLTAFSTTSCAPTSSAQSFTFTGSNLANPTANVTGTGSVTVTAPLGYKISLDNVTYTKFVNVSFVNCAIASTTVYAKLDTAVIGAYSGNITFSGGSVPANLLPTVAVTGVVGGVALKPASTVGYPASRGTINFGVVTTGVTSAVLVDSITGYALTGDINISSTNPDFQYSLDGITYSSSVTITVSGSTIVPSIPFYTKVTPTITGADVATITMSGGTPISCSYTFKDSVYGALACVSPSLPTTLTFTSTNATSTTVGFTPVGTADGYLLVRSTVPFVPGSDPVAGTNYAVSSALGNGTVVAINTTAPPYAATGLIGNTTYYYTVIPYNGGTVGGTCGGGPLYPAGTQLTGSVTTCPAATGTPTSSAVTGASFVATWTAPAGGSASTLTYLVDVSTNNTFTAPISGSPFTVSGTSLTVTGLLSSTAHYVRVTAIGACNSAVSSTLTVTTTDNFSALTITGGFNADIVANGSVQPQLGTSFPVSGITSFDNAGFDLVGAPYTYSTASRTLPNGGAFTSVATTGLPFQLADYSSNNALLIHSGASYPTTGTFTFPTPVKASSLYFLGISGTSTTSVTYRLNFTDGTTETSSAFTYPDWYTTTVSAPISLALRGVGRVSSTSIPSSAGETSTTSPSLAQALYSVTTAGQSKTIQSITATYSSGTGYVGIMGISIKSGSLISSVNTLPAFSTASCTSSSAQTFTITGNALFPTGGSIVAKAPIGFQVSNNGSTWDTVATITYAGNAMAATTVYVRFTPPTAGAFSGSVTFTGGTVNTPPTVAVSGNATGLAFTPTTTAAFGPVNIGTPSAGIRYTLGGTGLTAGTLTVTSSAAAFEVSSDSVTWSSSLNITNGTTSSDPVYIRFNPSATGLQTANISVTSSSMSCMPAAIVATGTGAVACTVPAMPVTPVFTGVTSSGASFGFTPSGSADVYLVIRSFTPFVPGSFPVTGVTYAVSDTFGNGKVAGVFTSLPPYAFTGLNSNSSYYYTVIPYNGGVTGTCAGGPLYATGTALSAQVITCPATPTFGTVTPALTSLTFNWGSVIGGAGYSTVNYSIDVSTNNTFTALVAGSPFTVSSPATSLTATGLSAGTTYYYRISASTTGCTSAYSATGSSTTTNYCTPNFGTSCSSGYYTNSVAVNGYVWNGTLASCGTTNYTATQIFTVTAGVAATYTATSTGFTGSAVWIDLNNDGDFFDAGENVVNLYSGASTATYSTTITVPGTVPTGTYRMRVIAGWGTNGSAGSGNGAGPCGSNGAGGIVYSYGGFNDFSVYVRNPVLTSSVSSLTSFGSINTCSTSTVQNFTITGSGLIPTAGNVVAHAPANFQVSTNGTTWDTIATYAYTGATLATTTVYARYAPLTVGATSGNITFTGGGSLTPPTVSVSGTGNGITLSSTATAAFGPVTVSTTSTPLTYSITGAGLTAGITTISTSNPDFQVSPDNVTYYTSSYNFATGTTLSSTPIYIVFTPTSTGAQTATITITATTGCVYTITATGTGAVACVAPSVPTTLTFTGTSASATTVGFTPVGSPDGYLVIRSYSAFAGGSDPITTHVYAVNDTFGNGRVVGSYTSGTSFPMTGLVSNTTYYYTIVPYNGGVTGSCSGGPLYPVASPLTGSVITCPGIPGTPTAVTTSGGMTISWTAPAGGSAATVNYIVDVASDTGFASPVIGSPFSVSGPTTSLSVGGLSATTTYYFRVKASGSCIGTASARGNATTTLYDYTTVTVSGFNQDVIADGAANPTVSTTADFDGASYNLLSQSYTYSGFSPVGTAYLPNSGSFNSAATSGLPYQLASYAGNNSLKLIAGQTGTLTFSSPQYASQLYVLASSGSGTSTSVILTANYEDGTSDAITTSIADWYGGSPVAIGAVGRLNRTTGATEGLTTGPSLYEFYLPVSAINYTKRITSLGVNFSGSGGVVNVMAVSKRAGALYASTNSLPAFASTDAGCTSSSQTFTVSGSTLYPSGGNITAIAPTGFQVSADGTTWGGTATFAYTLNSLSTRTVYVRFAPGASGVISGNVTFSGGTANNTPTIAVTGTGTLLSIAATGTSPIYCSGGSAVGLTATGGTTYTWAPATGLSATTGASVNANPSATTVYTVTGYNASGCTSSTGTVTVTYNVSTGPITGPSSVLCLPGAMALTQAGTGGTWSTSDGTIATVSGTGIVYGVSASVTPVVVTYNNATCGGSATYNVTVSNGGFTVSTTPTSGTYCSTGTALGITATGATSYSWSPASGLDVTTGAVVNASPTVTTTYTVIGTTGACSNTASITVWNTTPGIITGGVTTLCTTGTTSTTWSDTTAGGTWSISNPAVATITSGGVITSVGAGTATVTYTNAGCYVTRNITVNASPSLSATPASASVCGGVAITLTATGAATYSWAPGTGLSAATGASVTAAPVVNTTYTITGTSVAGCVSTLTKFVGVGAGVNAFASTSVANVCPGTSATLSSYGALTSGTTYNVISTPYAATTFTSSGSLTGDDYFSGMITLPFTFNYFGTNYSSININTNGILSFTNTASGNTSGYFTNYSCPSANLLTVTGAGIAFGNHDCNPTGTMLTYGSTGTAPNRKFIVNYNNIIGFTGTGTYSGQMILNENGSIDMMISALTPGTSTYGSTFGLQSGTAANGIAPAGRSAMASTTSITTPEGWHFYPVIASPTYSWSPSTGLSSSVVAGPTASVGSSTSYTVTITDASTGCSDTAITNINVYTPPNVTIPTPTIGCSGVAMTAAGASSYTWSPATGLSATTGATVTPNASVALTTYSVIGTDANGCKDTASLVVNPSPVISLSTPAAICNGGSGTITATGADTYTWLPSATLSASTGSTVTASPTITTTYTVSGVSVDGCASLVSPTRVFTVNATPVAGALTAASSYCLGSGSPFVINSAAASGTGVISSYNWSGPDAFSTTTSSPSVSFTPLSTAATGVYSLTVTYPGAGCTSASRTTGTVTVANYPTVYNVTGGNGCSSAGVTPGLSNSQATVSYDLKRGGATISTAVGTGATFDFAHVTTVGEYTIIGTGPGGCQSTMLGSDTVRITPAITLGGMPSICQPTTSPTVAFSGAVGSPLTYSIDWSAAANTDGINDVTNASLGASPLTLAIPASGALGYYTGNVTVANAYCVSGLLPVHITIYANPTASVTSVDQVCSNHDGYIHFAGVDSASVNYTIDGGSVNTFVFSGSTTSLSTGILTAPKTYIIQSAYNPVCSTTINDTFTINPTPMAWVGGQAGHESEWAYNANWTCGFAPTVVDDVEIGSATYAPSVATSSVANTRNLKLTSGSALLINSGGVVNVKGTLDNISTVYGDGKVVMNNTAAQTIRGIGTVSNLELDNTNGATIDAASRLMISKALSIAHGTLTTNDSLELLSSDTFAAARIAELPSSGATISGKVKVDQYIQGGYRRFRFWSHPFSDTISLSQMQNYIDITGVGGAVNGFTNTGSNAPSAFRFDTYTSCDTFSYDPGWKAFTKINSSATDVNMLHPYQGIRLFFRGVKNEGLGYLFGYTPSPVTVKQMGNVNQGDQIITLARGATSYQEYNLIGNPYPSPVDIGTILYEAQVSGDITGSAFYVWDPSVSPGGQYLAIDLGVGAPAPYYLQANAAFEVRAHHDGAILTFHESHKVATVDNYLFKAAPTSVSLNVYDVNYHLWDKLKLKFNEAATDNEDGKYDATKPMGTDFAFYSMSAEGRKLAIDARPYSAEKVIPLGVRTTYSQDFVVRAENVVVPDGGTIYLHDKLLQKYVELTTGTEYHFTITNDKATQGDDRFEISMKPGATVATVKGLALSMTPNPATDDVKISFTSGVKEEVKVRVLDMSGVSIYNENLGMKQNGVVNVPLSNFAAGIYMVELTQGTQKVTQKLVKE